VNTAAKLSASSPAAAKAPAAGLAESGRVTSGQAVDGSWPTLPQVRIGGPRSAVARALISRIAGRLPIRLQLPDGRMSGSGGPGAPVLRLRDADAFFARVGSGTAGFAESYMAGDWDSDDLPGLFRVLAAALPDLVPAPLRALRRLYIPRRPAAEDDSIDGARRNIERHYDLSNEFFRLFLDPTMTYSSALFDPADEATGDLAGPSGPAGPSGLAALERAQIRKIDRLLDLTGVGPGTRLLEIGTGWGELALRAARRGAALTSLTLSAAQRDTAARRAAAAGLSDRIEVQLRDYREAAGSYDAIVSVEMIEAVGAAYWPEYFAVMDRLLAPGGIAGIQAITMPHDQMRAAVDRQTWIHKYIFPGGQIPSLRAIEQALADHTSLRVTSDLAMGRHYARTLAHWRARFASAEADVAELGFSPEFRRMWDLYLAYSQAGFLAGYLDVHQLMLQAAARMPDKQS